MTELIPFLLRYKLIDKAGAWYILPDGTKFQGDVKLALALREDDTLREELCAAVRLKVAERHSSNEPNKPVPAKKTGARRKLRAKKAK